MTSENEQELLVFGYACKTFRDDERARQIDKGDFFVPWMGNSSLQIDRFDARGILSDLKVHEALGEELRRKDYLSPEDVCIEEMCDDERYRAMKIADEAEDTFRKEELAKRVEAQKAEIGFDYDSTNNGGGDQKQPTAAVASGNSGISLHQMATVIEKTSEFIATQGAQMEILMRAKEAHNPKFQFLNPDNPYHAIYKQVLEKKRARASGRLIQSKLPEVPSLEEVEESLRNLTRNLPSAAPNVSTTSSSTPTSCVTSAYSKLVEKIRENQVPPPQPAASSIAVKEATPPPPPPAAAVAVAAKQPAQEDENTVTVHVPPYEEQIMIDKTASYVCRLGGEKLGIVRKRMPEKFIFLRSDNKYNTYYQFKVALYHEMRAERHREQKARAVASANAATAALQDPTKKFPKLKGFFR
jgi:hypothetical protein